MKSTLELSVDRTAIAWAALLSNSVVAATTWLAHQLRAKPKFGRVTLPTLLLVSPSPPVVDAVVGRPTRA